MKKYLAEFCDTVDRYDRITVLTHINPDADTVGTGLGIYGYLKGLGKQVEIVNASADLPVHLDFLKYYSKIKNKIDYDNSLVIACDCGSIDRLGFDMDGREIINIDHHASNSKFGSLNIVDAGAVSSSEVAFKMLCNENISTDDVTAFYVALMSDTQKFSTANVSKETLRLASDMATMDINLAEINANMNQRRSLAANRVLGVALNNLELSSDGQIATIKISRDDMAATGAKSKNIDGIIDYAISLSTVKIALLLLETEDGNIKVSIRSKGADVSALAVEYGGGGHKKASGFEHKDSNMNTLLDGLREKIIAGEMI